MLEQEVLHRTEELRIAQAKLVEQERLAAICTFEVIQNSNHRWIDIQIHNDGEPIPVDVLPRLMQPFCSTKLAGTRLGLAIVKRIVIAHGGDIQIQANLESGTTVTIQLPMIEI